ncbi:MAG: Flp family type IVb pilin [Acidobacteriota bacterium]
MTAFYLWLKTQLNDLRNSEKGVTIVEYVIMVALVAIAVAFAQPNVRSAILNVFNLIQSAVNSSLS